MRRNRRSERGWRPEDLKNDPITAGQKLQGIAGLDAFGQNHPALLIRNQLHKWDSPTK